MFNKNSSIIAVIDSGIGGLAVLKSLIAKHKVGNYIYFADNLNMPYGEKSKRFVKKRVESLIEMLTKTYKVDLIIIACNTASSVIDTTKYKNVITMKFNQDYTYLATKLTKRNQKNLNVIADKKLASKIEKHILDKTKIEKVVKSQVKTHKLNKFKDIVLGCTHYELVSNLFKKHCPNTNIICNSSFVIDDIKTNFNNKEINIKFLISKESKSYTDKMLEILKINI